MKYECTMTSTIHFIIEADNEDEALDYLYSHNINDIIKAYEEAGETVEENFDESVCGEVDECYADEFAINAKEE